MSEGTVLEKLQVIISASTKPLRDEIGKVKNTVKNTSDIIDKHTARIGNAFKKVGKVVAVAVSVAAIVNFSKSCIELGSNLAEVQNVVDVTFGSMSEDINEFSKNAIRQFGLNETSAKRYSSTMGAMLKSMGLTSDAVLDMSKNLTGLAGDIASFYNLSADEAFAKIRSGISGETEPLKQLGINLSVANLEAYALSQGMTKAYSAMNQAEQATLRYNYLLSVTKDAQGDFARTSDSWANQTKILAESFNSLKASIGQGLINVFTPVIRIINIFISRLAVAAQAFQMFTEKIFGTSGSPSSGGLPGQIALAAAGTDNMASAMSDTADAAERANGSLAGFDRLNNRTSGSSGKASGTDAAMGADGGMALGKAAFEAAGDSADGQVGKVNSAVKKIKKIITSLTGFIDTNFGKTFKRIVQDARTNFNRLKSTVTKVWKDIGNLKTPLINWFTDDYVPYLNGLLSFASQTLSNLVIEFDETFNTIWDEFVYPVLQKFIIDGLPIITQFMTEALKTLGLWENEATEIFTMLLEEGISPVLSSLAMIWKDCIDIISKTWKTYGKPVFEGINEAVRNTSALFKEVWDKIVKPVWDSLINTINEVWSKHLKPFAANLAAFAAEFALCATTIYNNFIAPLIMWIVDRLAPKITAAFDNVAKFLGSIIGNIIGYFDGLVTKFRGIIQFITGVFTGDWRAAWEGVKKIFSGIWDSFVDLAKIPLNLLIGIINNFIIGAENAINALIGALNKISVKIPSWVPELGGKSFGVSLGKVNFSTIQYLAKGGIVDRATLSVIGEAGREAVVPLENNTGWMNVISDAVVSKMNITGIIGAINSLSNKIGNGNIYITAEMDGDVVYRKMVKRNRQHVIQTGKSEFVY